MLPLPPSLLQVQARTSYLFFIIFGVWKTLLSEARVTRDEVSGIATTSKILPERQYIFRESAFLNVRSLLPHLKAMHRIQVFVFNVKTTLPTNGFCYWQSQSCGVGFVWRMVERLKNLIGWQSVFRSCV